MEQINNLSNPDEIKNIKMACYDECLEIFDRKARNMGRSNILTKTEFNEVRNEIVELQNKLDENKKDDTDDDTENDINDDTEKEKEINEGDEEWD